MLAERARDITCARFANMRRVPARVLRRVLSRAETLERALARVKLVRTRFISRRIVAHIRPLSVLEQYLVWFGVVGSKCCYCV